jgi:hypothetical protein
MAEEVFSGRHWARIEFRERRLEGKVQRIADLFVPEQRVLTQHFRVRNTLFERKPAIRINAEPGPSIQVPQYSFDVRLVLFNAVPNLHFY